MKYIEEQRIDDTKKRYDFLFIMPYYIYFLHFVILFYLDLNSNYCSSKKR